MSKEGSCGSDCGGRGIFGCTIGGFLSSWIFLSHRFWRTRYTPTSNGSLKPFLLLLGIGFFIFVLDDPIYRWVLTFPESFRVFFDAITHSMAGSKWDLLVPLLLCIAIPLFIKSSSLSFRKRMFFPTLWSYGALFLISCLFSAILAFIGKIAIGRSRPYLFEQVGSLDFHFFLSGGIETESLLDVFKLPFSFPSGHATIIGVKAVFLWLIFPRLRFFIMMLVPLMAASRVVIGAHYPSDVIAGLFLGGGITFFLAKWMAQRHLGFRLLQDGSIVPLATGCRSYDSWNKGSRRKTMTKPELSREIKS